MCSVSVDTECNKPRETSRPVVGTKIQTSYNLEESYLIIITFWVMSTVSASATKFFWHSPIWLWFGIIVVLLGLIISTFPYTKIFLTLRHHQNQIQGHIEQPHQTDKSTEHREIQEGSVHCTVVAVHASCLLSIICNVSNSDHSNWVILNCFYCSQLYINFSLLKLAIKPDSLLLEDRRSETSSEGHNQKSALLLIELALVALDHLLPYQGMIFKTL